MTQLNSGDAGGALLNVAREFRATILRTLERGWMIAKTHPTMRPGTHEEEITEKLRDGMRDVVNQRTVGGPRMIVAPGTETRSRADVPRPDGRTDIPIYFPDVPEACYEHDPHAIIECKRVAGDNTTLCRLYVQEGIDRFVTGKYSGRHPVAFMTGYLQSGDAGLATDGINRHLLHSERSAECLSASTVPSEDWVRSSRHPRPGVATDIEIHHAFLGFLEE